MANILSASDTEKAVTIGKAAKAEEPTQTKILPFQLQTWHAVDKNYSPLLAFTSSPPNPAGGSSFIALVKPGNEVNDVVRG